MFGFLGLDGVVYLVAEELEEEVVVGWFDLLLHEFGLGSRTWVWAILILHSDYIILVKNFKNTQKKLIIMVCPYIPSYIK